MERWHGRSLARLSRCSLGAPAAAGMVDIVETRSGFGTTFIAKSAKAVMWMRLEFGKTIVTYRSLEEATGFCREARKDQLTIAQGHRSGADA